MLPQKLSGLLILIQVISCQRINNACLQWSQYNTRDTSPSPCWWDGDGDLTLEEIAASYGYTAQPFNVTTSDNYILTQFRINQNTGPSVILVHGIYQNAIAWTLQNKTSLAFILADAGYDVWLANLRGTYYSTNTVYNSSSKQFWDFTPHEMGTIDLKTIIEFVYGKNGNRRVLILGFSMGTSVALIYSSMLPGHAQQYVASQTLMAPVAYLNNLGTITMFSPIYWTILGTGLEAFNEYYIMKPTPQSRQATITAFTPTTANVWLYWNIGGSVAGYTCQLNSATYYATLKNGGDAIGVDVLNFYTNIIKKRVFVAYDYGSAQRNLQHYNTVTPPLYPLEQIQTATTLVYAENDKIASTSNVAALRGKLSTSTCVVRVPLIDFTHEDFGHAKDATSVLYLPLANEILKGTCVNATTFSCTGSFMQN